MTTETTHEHEYASKGIAGTGLGLGIAGTALGLLNGGLGLLNGNINNNQNQNCCKPRLVNQEELELKFELSQKDSEIALLKADKYTDTKIVDTYKELAGQIAKLNDKVDANRDRGDNRLSETYIALDNKIQCNKNYQDGINCQQLSYNAGNTATINCMQNQITQLMGMTKLVIPNTSVCPGWGAVTISPASLSAS